jgi:hypothetical protein
MAGSAPALNSTVAGAVTGTGTSGAGSGLGRIGDRPGDAPCDTSDRRKPGGTQHGGN